eukprot:1047938-Pyramimonas_sp.AAC.1
MAGRAAVGEHGGKVGCGPSGRTIDNDTPTIGQRGELGEARARRPAAGAHQPFWPPSWSSKTNTSILGEFSKKHLMIFF